MQITTPVRALLLLAASGAAHPSVEAVVQLQLQLLAANVETSKHTAKAAAHKPKVASLVSEAADVAHKVSTIAEARSALQAAHKAEKVWCGGMFADGCTACTQGNGESWCHGECAWSDGQCAAKAPTTTAAQPRPGPTTTAAARPVEPVVAASPATVKVLTQHSTQSGTTAAPSSSGAAPPAAQQSLHSVKFTPPATMKLDPQWAAHLAAAPQAAVPQATAAQSAPTQPAVHFEFAVPEAAGPQPTTTQTPAAASVAAAHQVAPQRVTSGSQPFAAWGDRARETVAQAAAAVATAPHVVANSTPAAPETSVPRAAVPEMVKQTVKFQPPTAVPELERFVHTAASTPAPGAGHFLAGHKKEEECACAFHGDCTCEASMAFMECISSSCAEGCECHDMQYHDACMQLSDACSPVGLSFTCDKERAVCLDHSHTTAAPAATQAPAFQRSVTYGVKPLPEIQAASDVDPITALYHSLNELKEDRCALELARDKGFVNAESHLTGVRLQIDSDMTELSNKCLKLPEMHCEKDFEEWGLPPSPCGDDEKESSSLFEGAPLQSRGSPASAVSSLAFAAVALATAASC